VVAGVLQPIAGTIEIAGIDVIRRPVLAKANLGFIPDRPFVYDKLTDIPDTLYGQGIGSHYQAQGLKLSKHFKQE